MNKEEKHTENTDVETVVVTGSDLITVLTNALFKIKTRPNTSGTYTVIIMIIKEETNANELQ